MIFFSGKLRTISPKKFICYLLYPIYIKHTYFTFNYIANANYSYIKHNKCIILLSRLKARVSSTRLGTAFRVCHVSYIKQRKERELFICFFVCERQLYRTDFPSWIEYNTKEKFNGWQRIRQIRHISKKYISSIF